ncbi:MAG: hypothetical protein AAGM22_09715, partial [Acidobacteriota bacterium]
MLVQPSEATGPSHLFIYMEPFAASLDGAVAFKVDSSGNATGAYTRLAMEAQYRWLCVDPDGRWHEIVYDEVDWAKFEVPDALTWEEQEQLYVEALEQASRAFQQNISIENPPADLGSLLESCSDTAWQAI